MRQKFSKRRRGFRPPTGHLQSQATLQNKAQTPKMKSKKRYDVSKLKDVTISKKYQSIIGGKVKPLLDDPDTNLDSTWDKIKAAFNSTAKEVLGMEKAKDRPQKALISQEVLEISKKRSKVKKAKQDDPSLKAKVQISEQRDQNKTRGCEHGEDKWLQDLCNEVEKIYGTI